MWCCLYTVQKESDVRCIEHDTIIYRYNIENGINMTSFVHGTISSKCPNKYKTQVCFIYACMDVPTQLELCLYD